MGEHVVDLTGLAFVTAVAVVMGLVSVRLKQPAIVGYILAGIVLGPTGLGLVRGTGQIMLLAELGVIMLLFLIGMELSLRAFLLVLRPAALTVIAQILISLVITLSFAALIGWSGVQAILLAFIVAVSSTAVAMRMLEDVGELRSETGRITVGVLIAQDIAVVPMLVLLESFSGEAANVADVGWKLVLSTLILFGVIRVLTRRGKIVLPFTDVIRGKVDLVALACVAFCFGSAALTGLFGLSAAFGAFIAGLVVASSTLRSEAIQVTHPIQSVLMVVFFLSIGLLIDIDFIFANIWTVTLFLIGVLVAKSVLNVAILRLVGEPWERAFPAGLIMAQIGEFSFVLATVGFSKGVIDWDGYRLAMAVIAMSLLISPVWMASLRRFDEVTRDGVTDFRAALGDVYASELHEIERGADFFRRASRHLSRRGRAMLLAWRRGRARHNVTRSHSPAAAALLDDPNVPATADAYPPEDAERRDRVAAPADGSGKPDGSER